jgi:hypothetical protein
MNSTPVPPPQQGKCHPLQQESPHAKASTILTRENLHCNDCKQETTFFFSNYTVLHWRHSQRPHTHPYYEHTRANPTPRSIFEDWVDKSSRFTKSPQASHCQRECRQPLKAQTPLNLEKFAPTGSRTYRWAFGPPGPALARARGGPLNCGLGQPDTNSRRAVSCLSVFKPLDLHGRYPQQDRRWGSP